jgi:Ca-activated chloride channel family protein
MRAAPGLAVICVLFAGGLASASVDKPTTSEGRLVTKQAGQLVDVPLAHTDVRIRVDGNIAEATVTQQFKNPYSTKIEAVYLFPLPTAAAVSDMTITSGGRVIHGRIEERGKAKQIYEAARSQGLVAALLTQERPNLFTQSVANLEPAATIDVTLHYVQRLEFDDGGYSLAFPMVAGPRYLPPTAKGQAQAIQPPVLSPGLRSSHDISLEVEIDAGVPIEGIGSTSHQIAVTRSGSHAKVKIQPADAIPNKDFVLSYQVAGDAPKFGVLGYRDGGTGSFMLVAQPPAAATPDKIAPREIILAVDTSSSMRGAPLAKAKELMRKILWDLRPDDTFQIIRFDDRASALGPGPIASKPKNIELALRWVGELQAGGTTEMVTGIETALAVPHDPLRLRIVAFITDGYVGNEDEILAKVGKQLGDSRLFTFGVGSSVNRYLLEEMASIGRGTVQVVRPDEDTTRAITAFTRRIDAPVLTDVRVDWGKLPVRDVVPHALPDLFIGQPLVLAGHYTGGGSGTVKVRGKQAGREVSFDVAVVLPERDATRPEIGTVWARQRITELSRHLLRKPDPAADKEILALSLEHHLLTQYTAFVAVDESRVTAGGAPKRVAVPVEVPDAVRNIPGGNNGYGWGYGGGGGSYGTIGHGSAMGESYSYGSSIGANYQLSAPITVTITQPVIQGDIDRAIIRRYVKRQEAKIRYCYEKALLQKPTLDGVVTAQFVVDGATGLVTASLATGVDKEVSACVAQVIKSIEFPRAPGAGKIQINYPFTLRQAGR